MPSLSVTEVKVHCYPPETSAGFPFPLLCGCESQDFPPSKPTTQYVCLKYLLYAHRQSDHLEFAVRQAQRLHGIYIQAKETNNKHNE
jgi:hypothetical protein